MQDNSFSPEEISVAVGTEVIWRNVGQNRHSTTSPDVWNSGALPRGQSWGAIFAAPGTYEYYCVVHPGQMRGRLIVTD
jgi:plastocyanin